MKKEELLKFDRQIKLFGVKGQEKINQTKVAILGLGGLGSHIAQQLAYLGVRNFYLLDGDIVKQPNLNRLIGAGPDDRGSSKLAIASRIIRAIEPNATIKKEEAFIPYKKLPEALDKVDIVFGAFDNDYARLKTLEAASLKQKVYIDSASGIEKNPGQDVIYGGRVIVCGESRGCLFCLDELDQRDIRVAHMTDQELKGEAKIYGIPLKELKKSSPSVVTINGVVASLATTEAMVCITGLRKPYKFLMYRGEKLNAYLDKFGSVVRRVNRAMAPTCPYCYQWGTFKK